MVSFSATVLFLLGAVVASFVGVMAARLNTGQSFFVGRSHCDACNALLAPSALVPIVSYLMLKGRAQCCGARFSLWAPISELLLGGLFVLAYLKVGFSDVLLLLLLLLSLSLLLALVLYDLMHQILPTPLLATFIFSSAVTGFLVAPSLSAFLGTFPVAVLIAVFFLLIHFLSRGRAMGFADAPFAFGLALLVGPVAFPGCIFSFWIGAIIGIGIVLKKPRGSRVGIEVPFAPFLAAGFLLAYFTQWNPFMIIPS